MCWLYESLSDMEKGFENGTYSRADLLYHLVAGAEKLGIDPEILTDTVLFDMGADGMKGAQGENPDDFLGLMSAPGVGSNVYGMERIKLTAKESVIRFHHCPLQAKWEKMGLSKERINQLCNIANKADLGRASNFKHVELSFPKRIGGGDEYCELHAVYKS